MTDKVPKPNGFEHFITRSGDRLFEGEKEFRFVSINIPNLHINEDPLPHWHRIDPWEVGNALQTINLMGGRVTRLYTLSVRGGIRPGMTGVVHLCGPGKFDDRLFEDLDLVLELAARHRIRLILPFIDQWDWFGGIKHFAAFYGKPASAFWSDRELIDAFKAVISFVLERVNSRTGIAYKDDPTIMAWETGNELDSPDPWIREIAAHIRSLDRNHLILDGHYGVSADSLNNPDLDIVSNHYYIDRGADILGRFHADIAMSRGRKPFLVGEFGHRDPQLIRELLDAVVAGGAVGAMAWSLRYHSKDGGFYYQGDPTDPDTHCMNWPGFPGRPGEIEKLDSLYRSAFRIQGLPIPSRPVPAPPELLPFRMPGELVWRGSPGARSYSIERAPSAAGPWRLAAEHVEEHAVPFTPFQVDHDSSLPYFRVCAYNESGISAPSKPVRAEDGRMHESGAANEEWRSAT